MASNDSKYKRNLLLIIAVPLLLYGGISELMSERLAASFSNMAVLRVGLVLFACWLAYPVLRRPAAWLPPGAAALGLILLGAVVASPKLLPVLIPLFGGLLSLAWVVNIFRRR